MKPAKGYSQPVAVPQVEELCSSKEQADDAGPSWACV